MADDTSQNKKQKSQPTTEEPANEKPAKEKSDDKFLIVGLEELQSVNEKLTTVNQELKIKIEELSQANNNFKNLMNSTDVGTIFLDRSLRIRLFTPQARDVFNVIETDVGRSLLDITSQVSQENLVADVEQVLNRLQPIQRELETASGRWYMMRISPYRTADDHIEGVVITLVDISLRREQEAELRSARDELEQRVGERTEELQKSNEALRAENVRRKKIEGERLSLIRAIVSAQEDERRRIARDLHDQMGQQLTALRLKLEALKEKGLRDADLATTVNNLQGVVTQLDSDVDFLAWQLRPFALDDFGLSAALSNYVNRWAEHFGIAAEFRAGDLVDQRLDPRVETTLYRIAQEALNNCAKHSECSRVDVLLERRDHDAVLIVEDNGVGFDPRAKAGGDGQWGIIGMRERAALLDGTLEIESTANGGTSIFVKVPLNLPSPASKQYTLETDR
jgi:signal transduction histidine kinase